MKALLLLFAGIVTVSLWLAPAAHADEAYCCVCSACAGPLTAVCMPIEAGGLTMEKGPCASACGGAGCAISNVVEGRCPATAAACEAQFSTARAPALSGRLLATLALALCAAGAMVARRRAA